MNEKRLIHLRDGRINHDAKFVMYWMQQSQRVHYNHALNHAISLANTYKLPLVVYFGLVTDYPEANERHYVFMLEGLKEVKELFTKLHINFVLRIEDGSKPMKEYLRQSQALVMDYGYVRYQRKWRKQVLEMIEEEFPDVFVDIVDTDLIVPVRVASDKAEYGAFTIRPKLTKLYQEFRDFKRLSRLRNTEHMFLRSDYDLIDPEGFCAGLNIDHSVKKSTYYEGGYLSANRLFLDFTENKVNEYVNSNDPSKNLTSKMSMYLHFGQISALELLDRMFMLHEQGQIDDSSFDAYIEQLLVRRELAFNFVTYQKGYDDFNHMTEDWAYQSMREHEEDKRVRLYTKEQLELAQTHDLYWNAAMKEMYFTGYMHNYMRMYWAKKIIEWMPNYQMAYETILYLNNKYFIDGRDPNSYAGVAWCFGKHDRAWTDRPIFGKLRYMNDKGLERKFDIMSYVNQMDLLK